MMSSEQRAAALMLTSRAWASRGQEGEGPLHVTQMEAINGSRLALSCLQMPAVRCPH